MPRIKITTSSKNKPSAQEHEDVQELKVRAALRKLNALDARIDRLVTNINRALNTDVEPGA